MVKRSRRLGGAQAKVSVGGLEDVAAAASSAAGKPAGKRKKDQLNEEQGASAVERPAKKRKRLKKSQEAQADSTVQLPAADSTKGASKADSIAAGTVKKAKKADAGVGETQPTESSTGSGTGDVDRTVFVDGVPYDWNQEKVREFFTQKCGAVASVRAPTWQDSGRSRGYAHVTFVETSSRQKALGLDNIKVGKKGRFLKIQPAKQAGAGEGGHNAAAAANLQGICRLFVKNLPYGASEAEIAAVFKACGKVKEVRVPTNKGQAKGFAYIEFAKSEALQAAINMKPAPTLGGRVLRLDADTGSGPKAGFHYRKEALGSKFGPSSKGSSKGGSNGGTKSRAAGAEPTKLSLF